MGVTSYDTIVKATAGCVAYWSLDGTVNDTKGTNHLSAGTAGTYVGGVDGGQAMLFNGVNQGIISAATIDFTATQSMTQIGFVKFNTYDLTNATTIWEMGTGAGTAGDGGILTVGNVANDPLVVNVIGNIGINNADYYLADFNWRTDIWYHFASVHDLSQAATEEVNLYLNGALLTRSAKRNSSENTTNLGNKLFCVGARNGSSLFSNMTVCKVAVFNTALSGATILSLFQSSQLGLGAKKSKNPMAVVGENKLNVA